MSNATNWITPTIDSINCIPAYEARFKQIDDAKVMALVAEQVASIRAAVRCCPKDNPSVGPSGTVPPEAVMHLRNLVLYSLFGAGAAGKDLDFQNQWRKACTWLEKVQACEICVSPAEDDAEEPSTGGTMKVLGRCSGCGKRTCCCKPGSCSDWNNL